MTKPPPKFPTGILFFGIAEIFIGGLTFSFFLGNLFIAAMFTSRAAVFSAVPLNVFLFIVTTSIISFGLGIGVLTSNRHARHMILFFAAMIILSKILIFAGIISLRGELVSRVSEPLRNILSIIYHAAILVYFNSKTVRERFK